MKFIETKIKELYIIEPEPYFDNRGNFFRVFCQKELATIGFNKNIVQINQSKNLIKGTIRGMHFQHPPKTEIKLVKCLRGKIFDVVVDIRTNSPTFLQWHGEILSAKNMKTIYIPEGFAHGFQTLKDNCEILYLHSEFYSAEYEDGLRYNDPVLNIKWPLELTEISERDKNHHLINDYFKGISI